MKTAEVHPQLPAGERLTSPEEFETLLRAYQVKNEQYLPAVQNLVNEGRLDRAVLARLGKVERAHIGLVATERNETGERFASADATVGELAVPDERYVPHEATHLLGGVSWEPLNEGLTQLMTDRITAEMDGEAEDLYEENKQFAHGVAQLAGFDIAPGSSLEDADWARLSRIFCGDDMEGNFNELNALVRRRTGADVLAEMRELQRNSEYLLRAKRTVGEEAWAQLRSSERQALEVREMRGTVETALARRLQNKTSRPLGRTAGGAIRPKSKIRQLFSRRAS